MLEANQLATPSLEHAEISVLAVPISGSNASALRRRCVNQDLRPRRRDLGCQGLHENDAVVLSSIAYRLDYRLLSKS